jgi:hypothetical protein
MGSDSRGCRGEDEVSPVIPALGDLIGLAAILGLGMLALRISRGERAR